MLKIALIHALKGMVFCTSNLDRKADINENEVEYLLKRCYQEIIYKSIVREEDEEFIIKPRFNESLKHSIIIYDIADYLESEGVNHEIFVTRMPDVVINLNKKYALEIETGTVINNSLKFKAKLDLLREKFGKVIDPRFIRYNIDKILEKYTNKAY